MKRRKNIFTKKSRWQVIGEKIAVVFGIVLVVALLGYGIYKGVGWMTWGSKGKDYSLKPAEITVLDGTKLNLESALTLESEGKPVKGKVSSVEVGKGLVTSNKENESSKSDEIEFDGEGEGSIQLTYTLENGKSVARDLKVKVVKAEDSKDNQEFITGNGKKMKRENGAFMVDGLPVINNVLKVSETFDPGESHEAKKAMDKMIAGAKKEGIHLEIVGGYRNWSQQKSGYESYFKLVGEKTAERYWAKAGSGDSQSGQSYDLNYMQPQLIDTAAGKWLDQNCYKYGFVIRFPKGEEEMTGFAYQPWHVRYVGDKLAAKLYNQGAWISIERYLGLPAKQ